MILRVDIIITPGPRIFSIKSSRSSSLNRKMPATLRCNFTPKDYFKIPSFKVANSYNSYINLNDQGAHFVGKIQDSNSSPIFPGDYQPRRWSFRSLNSFAKKNLEFKWQDLSNSFRNTISLSQSSPRTKGPGGERKKLGVYEVGLPGGPGSNAEVFHWLFGDLYQAIEAPGFKNKMENPRVDVKRPPGENHSNRMDVLLYAPVFTTNIN